MLNETSKYRLSVYQTRELIKETSDCRIETVFCTLDEKMYIKRTYSEDKREIFYALQSLNSNHIPKISEVIFDENTTVIEEYIQGKSLGELIESRQFTHKSAHKLIKQIFETLSVLHYNSIIHRDVKPDNIIVDENKNVWLIDFGIARFYDSSAYKDTERLGTVGYAPPEQFGFSQSDFRSDLYAAGVTIEEIGAAAKLSPNSSIMKAARKCRQFDPSHRYDSADAALREINQKCRSSKAVALLVVLLLAVFIIVYPQLLQKRTFLQVDEESPEVNRNQDKSINADIRWNPILDNYTGQDLPSIIIPHTSGKGSESIRLMANQSEISLLYELSDSILTLSLDDHELPEQKFSFSYRPLNDLDYVDAKTDAEILFYDMDGDGQDEILIALSDRSLLSGVNDMILCNTNWRTVWCIGYAPKEGFWQAAGMMVSFGNHGGISINYLGERELYCNDTGIWMRLSERVLQETN